MEFDTDLDARLRGSLRSQLAAQRSTLILNPVENIPFEADLAPVAGPLHGLYNSDKVRDRVGRRATDIQFSGRQDMEQDSRLVYDAWARALSAEDATLRLLSGLHAHIVLLMAMTVPGQKVLLLPVTAGGHLSGQAIVERLGLEVVEMVVDDEAQAIDMEATIEVCRREHPDVVLVDRSEGLVVEDVSALATAGAVTTVFDASQYLTNVICGDHPNPFDAGFDLVVASVHKNFPGPQKALLATRVVDDRWRRVLAGVSVYVSNMHAMSTYAAGLTLARGPWLSNYSRRMLDLAVALDDALLEAGVPVVRRPSDRPPTHHVWIREVERDRAFETFERLEACRILTNFRRLPYSLGFGIRLGTSAVARLGMTLDDVPRLAELIADIRSRGATTSLRGEARRFSEFIWARGEL